VLRVNIASVVLSTPLELGQSLDLELEQVLELELELEQLSITLGLVQLLRAQRMVNMVNTVHTPIILTAHGHMVRMEIGLIRHMAHTMPVMLQELKRTTQGFIKKEFLLPQTGDTHSTGKSYQDHMSGVMALEDKLLVAEGQDLQGQVSSIDAIELGHTPLITAPLNLMHVTTYTVAN